jgi:hypothetical protein
MQILDDAIAASKSFVNLTGAVGIAGFVFDISSDSVVELDSEITDHYVESGNPVEDHIALKPEKVTLSGFCGEYRNIVNDSKSSLQKVAEKLITVSSYLPPLNQAANSIYNLLNNKNSTDVNLGDVIDVGTDLFKAYRNINIPGDNQTEAFIFFEALRNSRATFTIQTPYRYYTDMAIESLKAVQSGTTKDESSFEITFKKIRFVNTKTTSLSESIIENAQGRLKNQISSVVNKGLTKGKELVSSVTSFWS